MSDNLTWLIALCEMVVIIIGISRRLISVSRCNDRCKSGRG